MKDLKEIFQRSDWKAKGLGSGPDNDWKIIVVSTIALVILASAWNLRMFIRINNGGAYAIEEETQGADVIDLEKLQKTVEYYRNKESEFNKIITGNATSTVSDPSI